MLAPQRFPYHTGCTEVLLVIDVVLEQVVNRLLRLPAAAALRDVARVCGHGHEVKVRGKAVRHRKCNVEEEIGVQSICRYLLADIRSQVMQERVSLGRTRKAHLRPTQNRVAAKMPARKGV